jgi:hypothetical protein
VGLGCEALRAEPRSIWYGHRSFTDYLTVKRVVHNVGGAAFELLLFTITIHPE